MSLQDTLVIESFEDPKVSRRLTNEKVNTFVIIRLNTLLSLASQQVKGVTLYISNFQRPLTERLTKDFFTDPSDASVSCAKTGKIEIADNIATGKGGEVSQSEMRLHSSVCESQKLPPLINCSSFYRRSLRNHGLSCSRRCESRGYTTSKRTQWSTFHSTLGSTRMMIPTSRVSRVVCVPSIWINVVGTVD